jgi:hypothetical protein
MTLLLDPDIRDWVVLPLFVIMVAAGLLRQSVGQLLQSAKQKIPPTAQRAENVLKQTTKIRSGAAHYMTTWKWSGRKQHYRQLLLDEADWCDQQHEQEQSKEKDSDDPMNMMMNNPLSMMKGNMAFMVQNMVMMQGIQHFFSGFILLKVPFNLTIGFKNMFQRGLAELPDLESSYVSSVSWYFLVMYGLRSFFKIAIGEPPLEVRHQEMAARSWGLQNQPPPGKAQDGEGMAKQLRQEAENLELILQQHKSDFDTVEKRLLGKTRYPKKSTLGKNSDDFFLGDDKKKAKKKSN